MVWKPFLLIYLLDFVIINEIALHSQWPAAVEDFEREKERRDGLKSLSTQARSCEGAAPLPSHQQNQLTRLSFNTKGDLATFKNLVFRLMAQQLLIDYKLKSKN